MQRKIGEALGRYTLVAPLGRGAMGQVYRARDTVLLRDVALKLLEPDAPSDASATVNPTVSPTINPTRTEALPAALGASPQAASIGDAHGDALAPAMLREARAAAALHHPNAVAVFEVGEWEGAAFLAMELIEGSTLRARLEGPLGVAPEEARTWLEAVGGALAAAHGQGIVHRDIKPENVMVREDGVVKVLDFGIARRIRARDLDVDPALGEAAARFTITGEWSAAGTPHYMPPEQLRGERLDGRADQFAWGVVAYELLVGRRPWSGKNALEAVSSMLADEPEPMGDRVAPALEAVVRRALARERDARYGSMEELLEAFRAADYAEPKTDEGTSRLPRPVFLGALLALGVLCAAALQSSFGTSARTPRAPRPAGPSSAEPGVAAPSEEALEAYASGVASFRDGSFRAARTALDRATALAPELAAAHLRRAMLQPFPDTMMRRQIQSATQFRGSLSVEDTALLDGMTPWAGVPADFAESERRLTEASARFPRSVDIAYLLGLARFERLELRSAVDAFDAALAIEPSFAGALYVRAATLRRLGDVAGVEETLARCFAVSPASTSCLRDTITIAENMGHCDDVVALSRRLIALDPDAPAPLKDLAQGLYATGAPRADVRAALEDEWARLPEDERRAGRAADLATLHVLYGELDDAEREARAWEEAVKGSPDEWDHAPTYRLRWSIAVERGRRAEVASLTDEYLHRFLAWAPDDFRLRSVIYAHQAKYRAGLFTATEFRAARDGWLVRERAAQLDHVLGGVSWIVTYAQPAMTPDDAREALAALPLYGELPTVMDRGVSAEEPIGDVYRLAGDVAAARTSLGIAAQSCAPLDYPIEQTRAIYALGLLLEGEKESAAACLSYARVVGRWGTSDSQTARDAKARRARLGCSARDGIDVVIRAR